MAVDAGKRKKPATNRPVAPERAPANADQSWDRHAQVLSLVEEIRARRAARQRRDPLPRA